MDRKAASRKNSSSRGTLAALKRAAAKAIEIARRTGTHAYVLEGGKIVDAARRRPVKRKSKGS